jgi:hypothetical protein
MMHIHDGIEAPGRDHIDHIRDSLQPYWVNCPIWGTAGEVVGISHWESDTLEATSLHGIERRRHYWSVVPGPFIGNSI